MTRARLGTLAAVLWAGLGLCVPGLGAVLAGSDAGPAKSAVSYRITGVAVSTRDGSPVPFCHIAAQFSALAQPQTGNPAEERRGRPGRGEDDPTLRAPGREMIRGVGAQGGAFRNQGPARVARPASPEVLADATGHFSLEVPKAGAWRLIGSARSFHAQHYDEHEGFYSDVVLTASAPVVNVTFRLEPDAMISGLVLDEAGEPVRNAPVSVELVPAPIPGDPLPTARQVGYAITDDRGRYEVDGLAGGDYRVKVDAQPWYTRGGRFSLAGGGGQMVNAGTVAASPDPSLDMVYGTVYYPGTQDEAAAGIVQVRGGEDRQADFSLVAVPAAHLEVPRNDSTAPADGRPRAQRSVSISRISRDGNIQNTTTTSGTSWIFGGLVAGTYEVRTQGPDGEPDGEVRQIVIGQGSSGVLSMEGAKALSRITISIDGVPEEQVNNVMFVDTVTGRTVFTRGGRQEVGRNRRDAPPVPLGVSLAAHRYEVVLNNNGSLYLAGMTAKGAQVYGRQIEVGEGDVQLTLHVASGKADVAGFARLGSPAGEPAAGAMVLLVPATLGEPGNLTEIQRDETNTDGSFDLHNVIPGRYILLAIDRGWRTNWRDPATLAGYLGHGVPIDLTSGGKVKKEIVALTP